MKAVRNGLILGVVAALATSVSAQTSYNGTGGPIGGNPIGCGDVNSVAVTYGAINIAGSPLATNMSVDLLGLNHTWAGDLSAQLTRSAGGAYTTTLFDRPGTSGAACGNASDFIAGNTYRWDNSGVAFPEAPPSPIPSSVWRPTGDLGAPSTALLGSPGGTNVNGTWKDRKSVV